MNVFPLISLRLNHAYCRSGSQGGPVDVHMHVVPHIIGSDHSAKAENLGFGNTRMRTWRLLEPIEPYVASQEAREGRSS
jgi:hypothetical protein